MSVQTIRTVCVFCGSRPGKRPEYLAAARSMGAEIAKRGWALVYGGSKIGLMGALADAARLGGAHTVGVMPKLLADREIAHEGLAEFVLTDSMHSRKATMISKADAFVVLPGGFGTLDELFECVTWAQLGLHQKPIGLLDIEGYYSRLMRVVDAAIDEGFVPADQRALLLLAANPAELCDRLAGYVPPELGPKF